MDVIKEIFCGRELTLTKEKGFILNKWGKGESFYIPMRVANYLINCEVLVLDSGNFETGEQHFVYNREHNKGQVANDRLLEELKPILRDIRIDKILK